MTYQKTVEIIGGGTFSHIRSHLALAAPAFGNTARILKAMCEEHSDKLKVNLTVTKMGDHRSQLVTNEDVSLWIDDIVRDVNVKIVFFTAAICDFDGFVDDDGTGTESGKHEPRLDSKYGVTLDLAPAPKLVPNIRRNRKDIFLVSVKTTCGATPDEQYVAALGLLKGSSSNLVLANKPFNGATVGHFAVKLNDRTFLTSKRKTNFNELEKTGLVRVEVDGPDSVIAYGSKPSVGGQSQRIIFHEHTEYDCIVHAHVPIKTDSVVPQISQREVECGSHQCGQNTSSGPRRFGNLSAVYLKEHGPNVVFHHSIDPQEVIDFILENFDLSQKTGGPAQLKSLIVS